MPQILFGTTSNLNKIDAITFIFLFWSLLMICVK